MIEALIKIRFKQGYRGIKGIGPIRMLLLMVLVGFGAAFMFIQFSNTPNVYYITAGYLFVVSLIHQRRQDKVFFKSHFVNYKLIYFAEYFLFLIPALFFLVYHFQWILAVSVLLGAGLIVQSDFKPIQRSLNTKLQELIPHDCFEWKAGIRKTIFLIIVIWLAGLAASFFTGTVPIVIFILGIIPLSFYEKGEPYQMILAYEMSTNRFLVHKMKLQIGLFSMLTIPLMLMFFIFHAEFWYIVLVEYVLFISLHVFLILTKYAFYEPNSKSSSAQLFGAFGATGIIIPVFLPIVWLLSIRFYFKSREKLNFYLNDYN